MSGNKYKYTDTNAPTMAEECYIISRLGEPLLRNRKTSRYCELQNQLISLENRLELLDDDMLEIKKILSKKKTKVTQNYNSSDRGEASLLCNNESESE